jgi:hypothetical protein
MERAGTLQPINFDGLLAAAKLSWFFGPVAKTAYDVTALARPELSLSYDHDYRDHVITDYYLEDRARLQWIQPSSDSFLLRLHGGVSRVAYHQGQVVSGGGTGPMISPLITGGDSEVRLHGGASAEYVLYRGLRLAGRLDLSAALSDLTVSSSDPAGTPTPLAFSRFQAFFGAYYLY